MSEDILINITPQETRVALILQGAVQELHIERTLSRGLAGNIYLGKVVRVLPGMQSAFIDIGLERAAFLHVADIWEARPHDGQNAPAIPIEKLLHDGQTITVQVIKDPIGTKGARLSTQISIAGRMLVYLPQDKHIGISQRIENEAERELLRSKVQALLPPEEKGGFIIRTMAEDASDADLQMDVEYLRTTWSTITKQAKTKPAPTLLHQDLSLAQRVLRDFVSDHTATIQVDSRENFHMLQEFGAIYTPSVLTKLMHYRGERPLFDLYGVEEEIERALGRRVDLKSGGYLIVDQTEAMTTIDVNTGSFVNGRNFDDTIFKTNLEAAHAIARQLRLRNLGGIIILDFIDMESTEHRQAVLAELGKALQRDRTKISVSGFSTLGLVEMTRKRTRESLAHILCETCPACKGRGQVKTSRTVCYEILREVMREAKQFNPREFRILASQVVVDMFLEEESQHLAMLGDFIGKPISLQVQSDYQQEQYDIILM
ncbi:ribonuclease G [Herbaspirillum rubrisubalbicans]|uniref:Ribonuclease G n=2 Tax=Herbaspirillum rubrisubalbicans TaxID=80842 RepID=A0ABX9BXH2_9BURK|nr:ribonuclease G [Herbaspirillum rubrisubalbicans]MCP1574022.1 ribonuclease G [Herbaspirillum rubrisubalbicans]QJQ02560.1 Rne/Rng family ribonuclease [Herbaspirillum rubrisubalbicans Os34]RAM62644.1 ribonuclease G [Herbaspirillum rubrisubalbicans]RAN43197.1 ribonuclease G [Herbaspirillum rubrisubalbicans]